MRNHQTGQFLPGESGNPTGNNGHNVGWQRYGDRLQKWLALPAGEIAAIVQDEQKLKALSSIDAVCVRHVANMIGGKNTLAALKEALDRIEGTPKQTIAHSGTDEGAPIVLTLRPPTSPFERTPSMTSTKDV